VLLRERVGARRPKQEAVGVLDVPGDQPALGGEAAAPAVRRCPRALLSSCCASGYVVSASLSAFCLLSAI
jgi:hypothetical protein